MNGSHREYPTFAIRERPVHALMLPLALPIVGLLIGCYFAGLVAPSGWSSG